MYRRILVPVDGSSPAHSALLEAIRIAKSQSSLIRLLHVVNEHVLDPDYCMGTYPGDLVDALREAGRKVLLEGAELVRQSGVSVDPVAVESAEGSAAPLIVAQAMAWGADLIVMGTHGRRGLARLALGSEAECVVRTTRIPVLLIHDGARSTPEAAKTATAGGIACGMMS